MGGVAFTPNSEAVAAKIDSELVRVSQSGILNGRLAHSAGVTEQRGIRVAEPRWGFDGCQTTRRPEAFGHESLDRSLES